MVRARMSTWIVTAPLIVGTWCAISAPAAMAAEAQAQQEVAPGEAIPMSNAVRAVGIALAAAVTMAGAAMATARVQAAVGAGGTGVLAEKPELFTTIIILIAIPETLVILGFVLAYVLVGLI